MNILIVGNSAAGVSAVEAIRKNDQTSTIVQLSDERQSLYSRCLLSYYLSNTISKTGLQYRDEKFHQRMHVHLHTGKRAFGVDINRQQVTCNDGSIYPFDRLLIAAGSSAKLPDSIPKEIDGVYVLRTIDDAEIIKKKIVQVRNAVVLGGGLIGMKAACALHDCGLKTKVIVRSNHVLSQMIDTEASQILIDQLVINGIEVLTQTDIVEIQSMGNQLKAVRTEQGETIPCEILIVAKGVQPNTELIQDTDIKKRWGIETNKFMQTNYENIFAAGDVAEAFDIATEGHTINALWTSAVQQGRIAGLNMTGKTTPYYGTVGMNSLNINDIPLISYGITFPKDASRYKILTENRNWNNVYKKVVLENHRIKGIILLGKIGSAGVLLSLLRHKVDVSSFEDQLLSDQFNFGKLIRYGVVP
ncbi:MAG: FAD/NAD(P)-binding oxidoreductase, partial [Bacteroidota bacterium]